VAKKACTQLANTLAALPDQIFEDQMKQVRIMDQLLAGGKSCLVLEVFPTEVSGQVATASQGVPIFALVNVTRA
jgi:hypothetical protein